MLTEIETTARQIKSTALNAGLRKRVEERGDNSCLERMQTDPSIEANHSAILPGSVFGIFVDLRFDSLDVAKGSIKEMLDGTVLNPDT